ncbi:MAG TPA: metalloregulator ArsR/SmtB family transcription factor [Candidatus Acidoferrales bacterium]
MGATLTQSRDIFSALGDWLRLRLACCLLSQPEGLCVCELVDALDVTQPNVSQHLKQMKSAGLVDERRDGRFIYYRLRDAQHPFLNSLRCCLESCCCAPEVQQDLGRLRQRLELRRDGKCVVGFRPASRRVAQQA